MTRYIYHVSVHKQDALCPDVHAVTAFINDTMGCKFVTLDMVYNYFNLQRLEQAHFRRPGTHQAVARART